VTVSTDSRTASTRMRFGVGISAGAWREANPAVMLRPQKLGPPQAQHAVSGDSLERQAQISPPDPVPLAACCRRRAGGGNPGLPGVAWTLHTYGGQMKRNAAKINGNPRHLQLRLESLKDIDFGRLSAQWDLMLDHLVGDCKARPNVEKDRVITLEVRLAPMVDPNGNDPELERVSFSAKVKSKVPDRQSDAITMMVKADGKVVFHADEPDEPEVGQLYDRSQSDAADKTE
jgi:hypothetical protein